MFLDFFLVRRDDIGKLVSIEEPDIIINKMPKENNPRPDGWTQELFDTFFDILGKDLLLDVEESRNTCYISGALNSTFFALIPKVRKPSSFHDFKPIALCKFAYKVISKVIINCIKDKFSLCLSQ